MQPSTIPQGRLAKRAWRALSPEARRAAFAATSDGAALSDLHVAWTAAGYGRLVTRRLRILRMLVPLGAVLVVAPVSVALVELGALPILTELVFVLLIVWIVGGILGLAVWGRRYQRLYSSGLLAIEAAQLGGTGQPPDRSAWETATAESEFTVPYHAQVPVVEPLPPPTADPAAAGVHEIPIRRAPILAYVTVLLVVTVALWLFAVSLWSGHARIPILASVLTLCAIGYTALVLAILYVFGPALKRPVTARFTPDGWQLPLSGMSGPWAEVRAIQVRPLAARGTLGSAPQLATMRVVALVVEDPEAHLARLSPVRRWLVRRKVTRYGSPIVIVAAQRQSMPVVELVHLLAHYTSAPVEWA